MSDAEMEEAARSRAEAVARVRACGRRLKKAAATPRGIIAVCVCVTGIIVTIFVAVESGVIVAIASFVKDFIDIAIDIEESK